MTQALYAHMNNKRKKNNNKKTKKTNELGGQGINMVHQRKP
jgi:hypothetical protein